MREQQQRQQQQQQTLVCGKPDIIVVADSEFALLANGDLKGEYPVDPSGSVIEAVTYGDLLHRPGEDLGLEVAHFLDVMRDLGRSIDLNVPLHAPRGEEDSGDLPDDNAVVVLAHGGVEEGLEDLRSFVVAEACLLDELFLGEEEGGNPYTLRITGKHCAIALPFHKGGVFCEGHVFLGGEGEEKKKKEK